MTKQRRILPTRFSVTACWVTVGMYVSTSINGAVNEDWFTMGGAAFGGFVFTALGVLYELRRNIAVRAARELEILERLELFYESRDQK